jgi:hypothetical protein
LPAAVAADVAVVAEEHVEAEAFPAVVDGLAADFLRR